jgi:hypothetical protein
VSNQHPQVLCHVAHVTRDDMQLYGDCRGRFEDISLHLSYGAMVNSNEREQRQPVARPGFEPVSTRSVNRCHYTPSLCVCLYSSAVFIDA